MDRGFEGPYPSKYVALKLRIGGSQTLYLFSVMMCWIADCFPQERSLQDPY
jgi:hypothetical protein